MSTIPANPTLSLKSERGMIVLYDPSLLQERVKAPSTWWREDPLATAERQDGRVALWPLSAGKATRRSYRIRLGGALTEGEEPFVVGRADPAPWTVSSDEVFLGPVERLPGDGSGSRLSAIPDAGQVLVMEPGSYTVTACVLDWQHEESFFNEDNEVLPTAPPDVVLLVEAVETLPAAPSNPGPLLDLLPTKTPTASTKVRFATRPRPKPTPEPRRRRARAGSATGSRSRRPVEVKELRPGELGVGARVRHPTYGVGTVLFMKEGFPKAKVSFLNSQTKVDKDDLTVL